MLKYIFLPVILFPYISLAKEPIPNNVKINFSGPAGSTSVMNFKKTGSRYTLSYQLNIPVYKITYTSLGSIKNNHLSTEQFIESRRDRTYSTALFNRARGIVTYGKTIDQPKKSSRIVGNSYDTISLPWEMSFNPDLVLKTFQITNGKDIYKINAGNMPISRIKTSKVISTKNGKMSADMYDLELIRGNKNAIKVGYSKQHYNLPIYILIKKNGHNFEFVATSITVDNKKIF